VTDRDARRCGTEKLNHRVHREKIESTENGQRGFAYL
jgi:hypothetical protein